MTLIVGFNSLPFTVVASDRLTTLSRQQRYAGQHDDLANKIIVLITADAAVVIRYCGTAYLENKPTDEWIAENLMPGASIRDPSGKVSAFGFKAFCAKRLHQLFNALRLRLGTVQGGSGVTILVKGWRRRRRRLLPISVILRHTMNLAADKDLRFTPDFMGGNCWFSHIGARVSSDDLLQSSIATRFGIDPIDAERTRDFLTEIVRRKSSTEQTVGGDIMTVMLHHPSVRRVVCRFDPLQVRTSKNVIDNVEDEQVVTFTPWFISPTGFHAPVESTGTQASSATFQIDGWTFETKLVARGPDTPSNFGWTKSQLRMGKP